MWEVSHISVSNLEFEILEFVWDLGFGILNFRPLTGGFVDFLPEPL